MSYLPKVIIILLLLSEFLLPSSEIKDISIKYEKGLFQTIPWGVVVLFLIIIFILSYKYMVLKSNTRKNEKYFEMINEHILILHIDIKGIITNVSEALCKLTGYTKNELLGKHCDIFTHEDTDASLYADVLNPLSLNNFWKGEIKSLKKDGSYYWADIKISALLDKNGLLRGYSSIRENITDKKEKDETIFKQAKLISMGEIITNIAHQWRQPLSEVNSVIMGIESDFNNNKMTKQSLETNLYKIEELTGYMSTTINNFHDFFSNDKVKTSFLISTKINKVLNLFEDSFKKANIKINVNLIDDVMIETYEDEILQVLIIILQNSKDAFIENDIQDSIINLEVNSVENKLVLLIQDNAGGIKSEIINSIFERHFSTKKQGHGIGLGLYLAKQLIEKSLHGSIDVQTNVNKTLFTINIPL